MKYKQYQIETNKQQFMILLFLRHTNSLLLVTLELIHVCNIAMKKYFECVK